MVENISGYAKSGVGSIRKAIEGGILLGEGNV